MRKETFGKKVYSDQGKKAVYDEMLEQMKESIKQKMFLVLDATFHKKEKREMFVEVKKGEEILFIEVRADENIIRKRSKKPRP